MGKKNWIIGVDFGATSVKMAKVDLEGNLYGKSWFSTSDFKSKDKLISGIVEGIRSIITENKGNVVGIGIGVPGQVDHKKGIIHNLVNVKEWRNVPLKDIIRKKIKLPLYLDNDANVACLGEKEWGAARGYDNIVCITLGSGVGGGLIINGKIYRGKNYSAGEIGHICIDRDGPRCNCGSRGCMEAFVGARYIKEEVVGRLRKNERSIILKLAKGEFSNITPKLISEAAAKGDRFSLNIWKNVGRNIGIGLAAVTNILNPEIIVIGGGISKAGEVLFDAIRQAVNNMALEVPVKGLKIVRARFIEDAGIVGAAALVKKEMGL